MLFKKKPRQQQDHTLKHDCFERIEHKLGKRHNGDRQVLQFGLFFHGPSEAPLIMLFHFFPINIMVFLPDIAVLFFVFFFPNCFYSWCLIWVCVFYLPWHRPASPRRLLWWCSCLFHTPQDTCSPRSLGSVTAPGSSWSHCPRWPPWSDPWTCRTGWKQINVYTGDTGAELTWFLTVSRWSGPSAGWVWVLHGWFWLQKLDEWG